jgi:hypothetical protein
MGNFTTADNFQPDHNFLDNLMRRENERQNTERYASELVEFLKSKETTIVFLRASHVPIDEIVEAMLKDMDNAKPVDFQFKWPTIMYRAIQEMILYYTVDNSDEVTTSLKNFYEYVNRWVII